MTVQLGRIVIILQLDAVAAAAVRQLTETVAPTAESRGMPVASVPPHVTLAVCRNLDVEALRPLLAQLAARTRTIATTFASLGVFPTEEGVIFLAPTFSQELLEVQLSILNCLGEVGAEVEPYWLPGQWVPHCTLATGIPRERMAAAVGRVYASLHPIPATLALLSVIEIESPRFLYAFGLSG